MKYLLLFAILFTTTAFAEDVRVYTDYTPVRILYTAPGADPDNVAAKSGLSGTFKVVDSSTIPNRTDRDAWVFASGRIKVDNNIKTERDQLAAKLAEDSASAITKLQGLGLTEDELNALRLETR
jgi:hypothetical protein